LPRILGRFLFRSFRARGEIGKKNVRKMKESERGAKKIAVLSLQMRV